MRSLSSACAISSVRAGASRGEFSRAQAELSIRSSSVSANPTTGPHRSSRSLIHREVSRTHPVGQPPPESRTPTALRPETCNLGSGAEDDELAELKPVVAALASELVERRLNGRRLGNNVASALRGHPRKCITGVTPRASHAEEARTRMR